MLGHFVFNYEKLETQFCIDDVQFCMMRSAKCLRTNQDRRLAGSNYVKPICSKLAPGINDI